MSDRTLCDVFYRSVDTFRKPDHLLVKREGAWRAISSEELRRAVEELSMGLRALGLEKGDRVGPPVREPPGVGLRRPRRALRGRHRRAHLPEPARAPGRSTS